MRVREIENGTVPVIERTGFFESLLDVDRDTILDQYRSKGVVLFRGFRLRPSIFQKFANQFCTGFVRNRAAGRKQISKDGKTNTVNLGGDMFPFHPEISREPWKPDVLFFGCIRPAGEGGETQLADGVAMVDAMDEETKTFLTNTRLLYRHPTSRESAARWLEVDDPDEATMEKLKDKKPFRFMLSPKGDYIREFTVPALHKPEFSDKLAFGSHILFSRFFFQRRDFPLLEDYSEIPEELCQELNRLAHEVHYAHAWQKGDLLMIDNTRFMHGRPAFEDTGKRLIISSFGYANFIDVPEERLANEPWRAEKVWFEENAS